MDSLKIWKSSDFWINRFSSLLSASINLLPGKMTANEIGPNWCEVIEVPVELPQMPVEFNGYRIVQISDLHLGSWMDGNRLAKLAEMVNHLQPDLIAITGDFISSEDPNLEDELVYGLSLLRAPDGITAVMGNHDHRHGLELVVRALKTVGIEILNNRSISINRGKARFWVAGTDSYTEGLANIQPILRHLPSSEPAILLVHEPDFADISAATGRFDLQLSGHTHGGQVVLPILGKLYLPRFGRKYPSGRYQIRNMTLYTNRGVGMIHLLLRWNCPPEITLFRLRSGDHAGG
jgi:predicted MPP superfamily phosphohydrolase